MMIINKTKLTQEAVKGVMHANNFENNRYKTFKIIYNAFGLLFGMMFIRYLIFQMISSAQADKMMLWLYGIVTAIFLYIGLYGMDRSNLKKFQNLYCKMVGITFTYEIDSDGIKVTDAEDDSDLFEWDKVIKWNQDAENFYIFVGIMECLVISKKGFEQGDEKDFKELVKAVMELRKMQEDANSDVDK